MTDQVSIHSFFLMCIVARLNSIMTLWPLQKAAGAKCARNLPALFLKPCYISSKRQREPLHFFYPFALPSKSHPLPPPVYAFFSLVCKRPTNQKRLPRRGHARQRRARPRRRKKKQEGGNSFHRAHCGFFVSFHPPTYPPLRPRTMNRRRKLATINIPHRFNFLSF